MALAFSAHPGSVFWLARMWQRNLCMSIRTPAKRLTSPLVEGYMTPSDTVLTLTVHV